MWKVEIRPKILPPNFPLASRMGLLVTPKAFGVMNF
jgi:hypothetical protein